MPPEHPNPYHDEVPEDVEEAIGGALMDPDSDLEGDLTSEAVAAVGDDEYLLTAEEAAMHIVPEDQDDDA